jgi:hypothetical protein
MKEAINAILEIMQAQTEPLKFKDLIMKMYNDKGINVTHSHLNVLIFRKKIERTKQGFYQICTAQVERS